MGQSVAIEQLWELAHQMEGPRILELGVKRSDPNRSTMHRDWFLHASTFIGTDYEAGLDVDVVADVHDLGRQFEPESFDIIMSFSTFEHIRYPWIAVEELAKITAPGGLVFVQTHQSFPLHAYPHDYWRYTTEALESLFCPRVGFHVLHSEYALPCRITSPHDVHAAKLPSYLNVHLLARKRENAVAEGLVDWRDIYGHLPQAER